MKFYVALALVGASVLYCIWRYQQWVSGLNRCPSPPQDEFEGVVNSVEEFFRKD